MPEKNIADTYKKFAEACRKCDPAASPDEAGYLLGKAAALVERLLEEGRYKGYGERIAELETRISELEKNINKPVNKKSPQKKSAPKNPGTDKNFERFWEVYPKKVAKQSAYKAWVKISANDELAEKIISALEQHKKSPQWLEDGGRFIPYPATWLNGKQWEDEVFTGISENPAGSKNPFINAVIGSDKNAGE